MNLKKSRAEQQAIGALKGALKRTSACIGQDFDVAVAVSGGADSLALATTVSKVLGKGNFFSITVDHGLQPKSDDVSKSAAIQCLELGARVAIQEKVSIQGAANLEAKARDARYEVFRKIITQHENEHMQKLVVLLAHTLDDQAETVLLGLSRGSGTSALFGMSEFTNNYLRPFLAVRRSQTEEICTANGLDYWIDPTNSCAEEDDLSKFPMRSKVRSLLLPKFECLFPGIRKNLARTATILGADSIYLEKVARDEYENCISMYKNEVELSIEKLQLLEYALRWRIIRIWCKTHADSEQHSFERILEIDRRLIQLNGLGGRNIELPGKKIVHRTKRNTLQLQNVIPLALKEH
ncbi:MAG: tRNA lysidine(34) synthetase TilS [Candidatus Ancillula sp.]|jgi:tRNA(Ile)-lysidine synthase|nr:tRNA lysidine(34) synthetase TilS [Candidatus Ancillula sp.]